MKKPFKIKDPVKVIIEIINSGFSGGSRLLIRFFSGFTESLLPKMNPAFERFIFTVFFISLTVTAFAPSSYSLVIAAPPPPNAFSSLIYATGMVETMGNTLAYNDFENAAGIFQIRQVRVDHYNKETGSKYTLADMFDYSISEKVFLYFASNVGPYDFEKIAKAWNGSGPMTEFYWKRIKAYLE